MIDPATLVTTGILTCAAQAVFFFTLIFRDWLKEIDK
jgi:hypothetical protein